MSAYEKFESILLQQKVNKLSVPLHRWSFRIVCNIRKPPIRRSLRKPIREVCRHRRGPGASDSWTMSNSILELLNCDILAR